MLSALLALSACGGGSGGGGGGSVSVQAPSDTASLATISVALSRDAQTLAVTGESSDGVIAFDATVTGTPTGTVYADAVFDRGQLELAGAIARGSNGAYQVRLRALPNLALGTYTGVVTFRLCRDSGCSSVYPGSAGTFTYRLSKQTVGWSTFQGNASHNGYVPATFDTVRFQKAWDFAPASTNRLTTVASAGDKAFVTTFGTDGTSNIRAVSTATGEERWLYTVGKTSYTSAPAVAGGRVYVTSMVSSSSENTVFPIDAATGQYLGPNALFASQWSFFLQPTPFEQSVYISAGYYGNVVYGSDFNALKQWTYTSTGGRIWDGETPAVDSDNVYYYAGPSLDVIDRQTGTLKKSMPDPFFQGTFYSYYGAPVIGSAGNVLAYSGHRSATAPSVLVNWSVASGAYAWRSANAYVTSPAVANGVVYVSRNDPSRLDALSEANGAILWSWSPPSGERFVGNTIATQSHIFVSTDRSVYALPVSGSRTPVWSAPVAGEMAITGDGMLIVAVKQPGNFAATTLTAYRLR